MNNQNGFRAFNRKVISIFKDFKYEGYAFCTEQIIKATIKGFRIKECPIKLYDRKYGTSNIIMLNRMKLGDDPEYISAKIALVENGGEIAVDSEEDMKIALFAGYNELNLNIGFLIEKNTGLLGIGTSSATIGHAISLGQADAVTIFARDATLADAAATRIANLVKGVDVEKSIKNALDAAEDIDGVYGAFISRENKVGQVGKLPKFFKIEGNKNLVLKDKFEGIFPGKYDILK